MQPDWKNNDSYSDLSNASGSEWAWEFLRRNPRYRAAYIQRLNSTASQQEPAEQPADPADFYLKDWADPQLKYDKKAIKFKSIIKLVAYHPEPKSRTTPSGRLIAKKLGDVVIKFDVHMKLDSQLAEAKRRLEWWQKKIMKEFGAKPLKPRARTDLYVRYLRVLDALEAKVSMAKILEVFDSEEMKDIDEKSIRHARKRGLELRDEIYRYLLHSPK